MTMGTRIAVMKDGVLQQLDTPRHIYNHPANTFVAGFIGSPAMNFFEAGVSISNGHADLAGDGFTLRLSGRSARDVAPYHGGRVVMGIRPEHLDRVSQGEDEANGELPATVEVVESMGSEQHLYLTTGHKGFVAKVGADLRVRMGDQVKLAYPKELVHLFDPATERSITAS